MSACVLGYDVDKDYHIAATTRLFPLKSVEISEIIARSEDRNITFWKHHSRHDEPPLRGIPDKAVEFQILLLLLRLEVGQRLEDPHEVLVGRCPRPTELHEDLAPWEDFVSGHQAVQNPDSLCASSLPLQEVNTMLPGGAPQRRRLWLCFSRAQDSEALLPFESQMGCSLLKQLERDAAMTVLIPCSLRIRDNTSQRVQRVLTLRVRSTHWLIC
eukprot:s2924_g10.t1